MPMSHAAQELSCPPAKQRPAGEWLRSHRRRRMSSFQSRRVPIRCGMWGAEDPPSSCGSSPDWRCHHSALVLRREGTSGDQIMETDGGRSQGQVETRCCCCVPSCIWSNRWWTADRPRFASSNLGLPWPSLHFAIPLHSGSARGTYVHTMYIPSYITTSHLPSPEPAAF